MKAINPRLKSAAQFLLPDWVFSTVQSIRSRNYQRQLLREWGVEQATREMIGAYGLTVLRGPFQGMRYPRPSLASRDGIPILFATYEMELHPVIEEVASKKYDRIIDIGCAEGYYAVGFALRTGTPVYAFDCEPRERFFLRQMARLNGVAGQVHARSWCNASTLNNLVARRRCLVMADCEGYEYQLFQGKTIAALADSDLIMELHELESDADASGIMIERFRPTHQARTFTFDPQTAGSVVPEQWRKFSREFRNLAHKLLCLSAQTIPG
jgi:hypothetical protein